MFEWYRRRKVGKFLTKSEKEQESIDVVVGVKCNIKDIITNSEYAVHFVKLQAGKREVLYHTKRVNSIMLWPTLSKMQKECYQKADEAQHEIRDRGLRYVVHDVYNSCD